MMSPRPPHQQPLNALRPSTSTMAESPRPIQTTAFPHHQLPPPPPPTQLRNLPGAQRAPFPSLVLAPLAIPTPTTSSSRNSSHNGGGSSSNSGGSTVHPVHHQPGPLAQPSYVAQQRSKVSVPQQQQQQQQQQQLRADGRKTSTLGRLLSSQPPFASPTTPTFSSPPSYDLGYDQRYSRESDDCRRSSLSSMAPSPTFTARRRPSSSSEDTYRHQEGTPLGPSYSLGFPPTAAPEESGGAHHETSPNRSQGGRYQIQVRQQPVAARACGFGERDRRVIDPPPIVQLIVNDSSTGLSDPNEIRYPFNVVHCTLWSEDGNTDETALTGADKRLTRRLMGTLVSSPFVGLDEEGIEGCFFCFPDLSCRTHGKYRLRFVLMRLEPSDLELDGYTPIITQCMSDVFTVYTAKEFPGMRPSTALTKALKRQGCAISVKKGNEKAIGQAAGSGKDQDDGSGDEDTPSSGTGKSKRRRKT